MDKELHYIPNANVVRTARAFIRALCETYNHTQGMEVWDKIREVLGDQAASDIFLGMLTGCNSITVKSIGPNVIGAIKEVRTFTGMSLKESKDFVETVLHKGPQEIEIDNFSDYAVDQFCRNMKQIGCIVE